MDQLLEQYPHTPFKYLEEYGVSRSARSRYFVKEALARIEKGQPVVTVIDAGEITAFAIYRELSFDTTILGFKTGKVDLVVALNQSKDHYSKIVVRLIETFIDQDLKYVTYRVSADDKEAIEVMQSHGFEVVDGYNILLKPMGDVEVSGTDPQISIRDATQDDIPQLQKAVAPTFIYSRFFTDSVLSQQSATRMHEEWIANSIRGKVADHVFVADHQGQAVGFITLEMDKDAQDYFGIKIGHIPLIGTDPAFRGRHIGLQMTQYAVNNWFRAQEAEYIRIETQSTNTPANKTYQSAGFKLVDKAVTLRWTRR
jgi:ribosomal protein S18 acetylase RimI-like enzyme